MTEPHDLIIDHLKRIQDRLGRLEHGQTHIPEELRRHKSLIAGALHSQASQEAQHASLVARVERTPRRLDLVEG